MPKDTTFAKVSTHTVTYNEDAWPMDVIACLEPSQNWPASIGVLLSIEQNGHGSEDVGICCDPATADAIASALHVAAAQVRSARGETVEAKYVFDLPAIGGAFILDETVTRKQAAEVYAELGAWLAAHPGEVG